MNRPALSNESGLQGPPAMEGASERAAGPTTLGGIQSELKEENPASRVCQWTEQMPVEEVLNLTTSNTMRASIPTKLQTSTGKVLRLKALLDTGQSLVAGAAISLVCLRRLGLDVTDLRPPLNPHVGTAEDSGSIRNLGHHFMHVNKFDLVYSSGPAHVKHARGLTVEMVNVVHATVNPTAIPTPLCSIDPAVLLVADRVQLEPGMGGWATVTGPPPGKGQWMLNPGEKCCLPAIYATDSTVSVAVLNSSAEAITFLHGARLGTWVRVKPEVQADMEEELLHLDSQQSPANLWEELELEANPILAQDPQLKARVKQMIQDYKDVFTTSKERVGKTTWIEFSIELRPDAKPVKHRVRPLAPQMTSDLRVQLDEWLEDQVIETSVSPWASPLVPVKKKDGGTRWAIDFRGLNNVTVADSFPVPQISTILESLAGSKVFSSLDGAQAYLNIPRLDSTQER